MHHRVIVSDNNKWNSEQEKEIIEKLIRGEELDLNQKSYQVMMQPEAKLDMLKLDNDKRESLSPHKDVTVSNYSKFLIKEVSETIKTKTANRHAI